MRFGLIGKTLSHSFSKTYFEAKFEKEKLDHSYSNFELSTIQEFPDLLIKHPDLRGLNVTIPYKENIIPFLDEVDDIALEIGAVNTILIEDGKKHGFNTDVFGFEQSLKPLLESHFKKALILGSGGASKAIAFVLKKLGIEFRIVSRTPNSFQIDYDAARSIIDSHFLIVNTTPLGTYPDIQNQPPLVLHRLSSKHLVYDLIYNPAESQFLKLAKDSGADIKNGLEMLELQANKSWEIWNEF